jgi:hypothetical protein
MSNIKAKIINIIWNADPNSKRIKSILTKSGLNINITTSDVKIEIRGYEVINIVLKDPVIAAHQIVNHFDLIKYDAWTVSNIDSIEQIENDLAQDLFRKISELINSKIMIRNTVINQTINFIKNIFINAPLTKTSINLIDFHNNFTDKPFLIVAAGPSLDKQLPTLFQYQDYMYIIAVDKAYPSLKKYNIIPDFIITIDPKSTPSWEQDSLNDKTIFINDIGSNPVMTWSNNKNHIFISCQQEVMKIGNYFGMYSDMLETGGSVATSAFSFSFMAGANPIILIGQDLAFTNNKDHAEDYVNPFGEELIASKIKSGYVTKGYYGEDINTDKQFLMYKSWYETKFKKVNDRYIFNCTEGGANIEGAKNIPFPKICETLSQTIKPKQILLANPIPTAINFALIDKMSGEIKSTIILLNDIKSKIDYIHSEIENRKIFNKTIDLKIQSNLAHLDKLDDNLKLLISKFNQLSLYNFNRSTIRDERRTGAKLLIKYGLFFKETSKSIMMTINFLEGIAEAYRIINKNRVEITSDSINIIRKEMENFTEAKTTH